MNQTGDDSSDFNESDISIYSKENKEDDDKYKNTLEKVIASHEQDEYKELLLYNICLVKSPLKKVQDQK